MPAILCALLLTAVPAAGKALTADVACTATKTDKQFGYRYRYDVALSVRQGKVRQLKLSQRATSKHGDDQACQIGLDDLEQVPADGAILLREAGTQPNEKPHCTIRITADRKQIRIQIGDATEEGNHCRGSDDVAYCSPRSFWADMIVNRETKRC